MSHRFATALLAALLALTSVAAATAQEGNPIIRIMNAFTEAYNAQDAAAVASFYAEDAVLFLPNQPMIQGRAAIQQVYETAFAQGARNLSINVLDIRAYNNAAAYEISEMTVEIGSQRIVGRYMHIWEQQGDRIMLIRDIFQVVSVE